MANIYSEVGRAYNARRNGSSSDENTAVIRAIDLFDATTEDLIQKKLIRAKEIQQLIFEHKEHVDQNAPE